MSQTLLLRSLSRARTEVHFQEHQWAQLIGEARGAGLLGRLAVNSGYTVLEKPVPRPIVQALHCGNVLAADHARTVRWEVNRLERALREIDTPAVLLKGAAYLMTGLRAARGRFYADVDILVPRAALGEVESALQRAGWEGITPNEYDQHYYRCWMHELPPLKHRDRGTVVDVHHNILPLTGRVRPDPQLLFDDSLPLPNSRFRVLSPVDMLLHSAAHMFQDGEIHGALRNLLDIHDLLLHFGSAPGFWETLIPRAAQFHLQRPTFYALHYCGHLLETPIPDAVLQAASCGKPGWLTERLMNALVPRALVPKHAGAGALGSEFAAAALYLRSHWLKMPPWLLVRHLLHKCLRERKLA